VEEFLLDYPGCILIVSHDRYFMDRMVDHLFAFEGEGVIKDFPGNYSQYREAVANAKFTGYEVVAEKVAVAEEPVVKQKTVSNEIKKAILEEKMNTGSLNFEDLQKAAARIGDIVALLDEKEMRWLELSERM
jgi:ABC transport system ATP-binding/permease protein